MAQGWKTGQAQWCVAGTLSGGRREFLLRGYAPHWHRRRTGG